MTAAHIDHKQFDVMIKGDRPVLVDYWAPWCSYCRKITDAYDRIAEQFAGVADVVKVNIDENEALAEREKIEIIPTLVLYHEGKALGSIVAPESKAMIEEFLRELLPAQEKKDASSALLDMAIVGGGPGGYTAALYAARAGLRAAVIEKLSAGGQMALTHQIDNYPGFPEGVDGYELSEKMQQQAHRFGASTVYAEVMRMELAGDIKTLYTSEGEIRAKTVVLATGAGPRELGIEKEKTLIGRGVAYCAACDGMFYKGKTVVVVGGGNTAAADALLLSRIAKKVILVHRRDTLRATRVYHEPLMKAENVEFRWNSVVTELLHEDRLTGVRIQNVKDGSEALIEADGVFVSVGRTPASQLVQGQLELDAGGYIIADETTQTSLAGVYAVGDVRTKQLRQVVTAVADGAIAVHMAEEYLAAQP